MLGEAVLVVGTGLGPVAVFIESDVIGIDYPFLVAIQHMLLNDVVPLVIFVGLAGEDVTLTVHELE